MSILKIARIGHPVLLKKTHELKDIGSEKIKKIVYDLSETMIDSNGIGLAAVQVGVLKNLIVIDVSGKDEKKNPMFFINPKIRKFSH